MVFHQVLVDLLHNNCTLFTYERIFKKKGFRAPIDNPIWAILLLLNDRSCCVIVATDELISKGLEVFIPKIKGDLKAMLEIAEIYLLIIRELDLTIVYVQCIMFCFNRN